MSDEPGSCENQFHDDAHLLEEVYQAAEIARPFLDKMTYKGRVRLLRALKAVRDYRVIELTPAAAATSKGRE